MAKWDQILSLPVQSPSNLEFDASDLVWSKVEGWKDNIDRIALIPFARVNAFVKGESANKDCPTKFHVEARRRKLKASYKVKVDGVLDYIMYWCSFGPDDYRKGGVVRPSRTTHTRRKKPLGRPNTKRGCTCHFMVKRLMAEPSVALIIYNQDKHIDTNGLPCHGIEDKNAVGTNAMYAPFISEDLRLRIYSLLYVGVSVETIMQRHSESVEKQGGPTSRDDLLSHRYVRRQERSIRRSKYDLDEDDVVSLTMWVEKHPMKVFYYEDFSDSGPFTIGIQTEWQLEQMIRFGNRSLMVSDSRFGMHKFKYPVHSLLVFNSENKAIPVAWVITPMFVSGDSCKWMRALHNRAVEKDPTWKLAGFIVDDPLADISAIRDVFECSVLISLWRVRRAWHKNLTKRCVQSEIRIQILKRLGEAVSKTCTGQGTVSLFDTFMEDFKDNHDFIEYFKAVWYPRIGFWITALQTLPLATQETSAAIEFYHRQLNVRVVDEKDSYVYQRVDWLANKLATKVHSYFWLDEYPEKHDYARYWKDEWVDASTSWRNSLKIPDSDVILEDRWAKIVDQHDRDKVHSIADPGSLFSTCDCTLSDQGYLCEHVFKASKVYREKGSCKPSLSLYQYKQVLIKMLHCPPNNSLIRDHAVSLAALLQTQLNTLTRYCRSDGMVDNIAQENQNRGTIDSDVGSIQGVKEKDRSRESTFNEVLPSPSGLFSIHGVVPSEILSIDGEKACTIGDDNECEDNISCLGGCHKQMIDVGPRGVEISFVESLDGVGSDRFIGSDNFVADDIDSLLNQGLQDDDPHPAKKQKITCNEDNARQESKS